MYLSAQQRNESRLAVRIRDVHIGAVAKDEVETIEGFAARAVKDFVFAPTNRRVEWRRPTDFFFQKERHAPPR